MTEKEFPHIRVSKRTKKLLDECGHSTTYSYDSIISTLLRARKKNERLELLIELIKSYDGFGFERCLDNLAKHSRSSNDNVVKSDDSVNDLHYIKDVSE